APVQFIRGPVRGRQQSYASHGKLLRLLDDTEMTKQVSDQFYLFPSAPDLAGGNEAVKVAPFPGTLSIVRRPPWRLRMRLTKARPSPVPPGARLSAASTGYKRRVSR